LDFNLNLLAYIINAIVRPKKANFKAANYKPQGIKLLHWGLPAPLKTSTQSCAFFLFYASVRIILG